MVVVSSWLISVMIGTVMTKVPNKETFEIWRTADAVCFDVDSTL